MILSLFVTGCASTQKQESEVSQKEMNPFERKKIKENRLPDYIVEIPSSYFEKTADGGRLVDLNYATYEAFSYESHSQKIEKRAVVYLPEGYDESKKYNVLYLMHGGWSDETTYMGSPETGAKDFKFVMDHAIANGDIQPMIVVLPTYNNMCAEDSGDYQLAIQLTNRYHNELMNDLIPAVIENFSTYAEDVSVESIVKSRDHRAFAGFSMGSVMTWRTFQYNLNAFRYFMPSSGNVGFDGETYAQFVRNQGYSENDFFIFAASGTEDFAYASFRSQIMAMAENEMFHAADNETEGNLYFLEKKGFRHDGLAAMTYFYNGLTWLWKTEAEEQVSIATDPVFTLESTVEDVVNDEDLKGFGHLLFPVDRTVHPKATLKEISQSSTYLWYSNIHPEQTVEIVNYLKEEAGKGNQVFYSIYTSEEIAEDDSKADTGLFFFRGKPNQEFAIVNAGGGFMYVGAMHDSFPHALEISKNGMNAFALIYRPEDPYRDLARAITYIYDHAEELQVSPGGYSLWGGSAGARMAATLGNLDDLRQLTNRNDIPQASAVIMQYTGYSYTSKTDAPTYANVGSADGIADWSVMKKRLLSLQLLSIPTEFHVYSGLSHGYGIGTGTIAEGWIQNALAFWKQNMHS